MIKTRIPRIELGFLPESYDEHEVPRELYAMGHFFRQSDDDSDKPHPTEICHCCHQMFQESNLTETYDGILACPECLEEYFVRCGACECIVDKDDVDKGICPVCGNEVEE